MADQTLRTGNKTAPESQASGFEKTAGAAKSATEEALSAGRGLKDKAMEMAGSSSDTIKDLTAAEAQTMDGLCDAGMPGIRIESKRDGHSVVPRGEQRRRASAERR